MLTCAGGAAHGGAGPVPDSLSRTAEASPVLRRCARVLPAWSDGSFEPVLFGQGARRAEQPIRQCCSFIPSSANPATFCCHICRTRRRPLHQGHVPGRQRRPALPERRQFHSRHAGELQLRKYRQLHYADNTALGLSLHWVCMQTLNWHAVLCRWELPAGERAAPPATQASIQTWPMPASGSMPAYRWVAAETVSVGVAGRRRGRGAVGQQSHACKCAVAAAGTVAAPQSALTICCSTI